MALREASLLTKEGLREVQINTDKTLYALTHNNRKGTTTQAQVPNMQRQFLKLISLSMALREASLLA